jgi:hypothetical protein
MSDFRYFLETFRLSLYEALALLFPGAASLVLLKVYFPTLNLPPIEGMPVSLINIGLALVAGYVLKGISAEAAAKYRYQLLPWYRKLKLFAWVETGWRWPQHQPGFFVSSRPLPRSFMPPLLRVVLEPPLALFLYFYVPWREIRVDNKNYKQSEEFSRVKEAASEMFGLDKDKMKDWEYFTVCYGAIPKAEVDKRDRLDATGDMLRGLLVLTAASSLGIVVRSPHNAMLILLLLGHWIVGRALYNRVLRYDVLAERNIYRAFFNRFCRVASPGDAANSEQVDK